MSVNLSPVGGVAGQFFDNNGNPLSGGKIYTYVAGTSTPAATYTTTAGSNAHANPIILDAGGRVPGGEIWLTDSVSYKFTLNSSVDALIGTYDNIIGINSAFLNYTVQEEVIVATASQTVFNLGITYVPGDNSLTVFVDGVNQIVTDSYVETDGNTVTFVSGLNVGALVKFTTAVANSSGIETNALLVTYDPAGTGAEPTTVQAKLRESVSVLDFGVVTGVLSGAALTANTTKINAGIAENIGKVIYFPPGEYYFNGSIEINDQTDVSLMRPATSIIGAGMYTTIIHNLSSGYAITSSATVGQATVRSLAYHGRLEDFTIVCGESATTGSGISLESYWFPIIENVQVQNPTDYGICTKENATFTGLGINTDSYSCAGVQIIGCELSGAGKWNIFSDQLSNQFLISECYIVNGNFGGIQLASAGNTIQHSAIAGNGRGTDGLGTGGIAGIDITYNGGSPHNCVITNCEIDNNWYFQVATQGYHHRITQNRFIQSADLGYFRATTGIRLDPTNSAFPQEHVVEQNLFRLDSPGAAPFTGIVIPDGANGVGNRIVNNSFSSGASGLTKYDFAGTTRVRNVAIEQGTQVYGAVQSVYSSRPTAIVQVTSSQLLPSTAGKLAIASAYVDTNSLFDTSLSRFTPGCAGVVRISGSLLLRGLAGFTGATFHVYVSGVSAQTLVIPSGMATDSADFTYTFDLFQKVGVADYVEIYALTATGSTMYVIASTERLCFEVM